MKTMTCKQLGGACDKQFHADSFDEMAALSKEHGKQMFQQGDQAHLVAMDQMKQLMAKPGAMNEWFAAKKKEFDTLPQDE
jgi:hypothetical protein